MKAAILSIGCFTLIAISSFAQNSYPGQGVLTDIDGNQYKTLKIGSQIWMAENLKVSRYRNGDVIASSLNDEEWENVSTGAWSNYNDDSIIGKTYGKLYNWFAVNDPRGICPSGWHIPSDIEFQKFADYLGGDTIAGRQLQASGVAGFAALSAGYRFFTGKYNHLGIFTGFWTSSEANSVFAWLRALHFKDDPQFYLKFFGKKNGFSCRCMMD